MMAKFLVLGFAAAAVSTLALEAASAADHCDTAGIGCDDVGLLQMKANQKSEEAATDQLGFQTDVDFELNAHRCLPRNILSDAQCEQFAGSQGKAYVNTIQDGDEDLRPAGCFFDFGLDMFFFNDNLQSTYNFQDELYSQACTKQACHDVSIWHDSCEVYVKRNYCTASGGYGTGWSNWGSFAVFARDGYDAGTACCACGGGRVSNTPKPVPTPTSYTVHEGKYCEGHYVQQGVTPVECKNLCDADRRCISYQIISPAGLEDGYADWCVVNHGCTERSHPNWDRYVKDTTITLVPPYQRYCLEGFSCMDWRITGHSAGGCINHIGRADTLHQCWSACVSDPHCGTATWFGGCGGDCWLCPSDIRLWRSDRSPNCSTVQTCRLTGRETPCR